MSTNAIEIDNCRTGTAAGNRQSRRGIIRPAVILPGSIVLIAVVIQLSGILQSALQFDRQAVAAGQLWRLLTCHLVHCGWSHLLADMFGFATLWWLACRRPRPVPWLALASAVLIGLSLCLLAPDIQIYRGMSGVNFALFGYLLVIRLRTDSRLLRWVSLICLGLLIVEVVHELITGRAMTANSLPEGVIVVGVVHAVGLALGIVFGAGEIKGTGSNPVRHGDCSRWRLG